MAQEKKMAQEIIKVNKAILKNVTRFPVPFFPVLLFWSHFFLVLCFPRPILNPFSTGTHFHAYSAYYLPILYNFRKSCGGLKKHRFWQLILWSPQTLANVNDIFSSHLKLVLEICLSIEGPYLPFTSQTTYLSNSLSFLPHCFIFFFLPLPFLSFTHQVTSLLAPSV